MDCADMRYTPTSWCPASFRIARTFSDMKSTPNTAMYLCLGTWGGCVLTVRGEGAGKLQKAGKVWNRLADSNRPKSCRQKQVIVACPLLAFESPLFLVICPFLPSHAPSALPRPPLAITPLCPHAHPPPCSLAASLCHAHSCVRHDQRVTDVDVGPALSS